MSYLTSAEIVNKAGPFIASAVNKAKQAIANSGTSEALKEYYDIINRLVTELSAGRLGDEKDWEAMRQAVSFCSQYAPSFLCSGVYDDLRQAWAIIATKGGSTEPPQGGTTPTKPPSTTTQQTPVAKSNTLWWILGGVGVVGLAAGWWKLGGKKR